MPGLMQPLVPIAVVVVSLALCIATWSATLLPFWSVQAGHRDAQSYYTQGMGLWLNFTEHVGDLAFDPGNSLWIPEQATAVETYAAQCAAPRPFCTDAKGELHKQFCQVMDVYCGLPLLLVQWGMLALCGIAMLIVVWSVVLVVTKHRTIVDHQLMQICIAQGIGCLVVAGGWYFVFFHVVLNTTFYKDQYNRCIENATSRACWRMGTSVYLVVAGAVLYPFLSVLIASFLGDKFKNYRKKLRDLLEQSTHVELPSVDVHIKLNKPQSASATTLAMATITTTTTATATTTHRSGQAQAKTTTTSRKAPVPAGSGKATKPTATSLAPLRTATTGEDDDRETSAASASTDSQIESKD